MEHLFHNWLPIPQMEVLLDRKWFQITGVRGFERRLQKEYYLPRTHKKNEDGSVLTGGPLFPGNIFAALKTPRAVQWTGKFAPKYKVHKQKQFILLADLRFMKLAERLNSE